QKHQNLMTMYSGKIQAIQDVYNLQNDQQEVVIQQLREHPYNFEELMELDLSFCHIENLDEISRLTNLRTLNLLFCKKLQNIDGISKLTKLNQLLLTRPDSKSVASISHLTNLTVLGLFCCGKCNNIDGLAKLEQLNVLSLFDCFTIE